MNLHKKKDDKPVKEEFTGKLSDSDEVPWAEDKAVEFPVSSNGKWEEWPDKSPVMELSEKLTAVTKDLVEVEELLIRVYYGGAHFSSDSDTHRYMRQDINKYLKLKGKL